MILSTMTVLLIVHGLLAVALLGAITHQALAVWWPLRARAGNFVDRFRGVAVGHYVTAIVALYLATFLFGAIIYTHYRISVRIVIEQLGLWKAHGLFDSRSIFSPSASASCRPTSISGAIPATPRMSGRATFSP